MVKNNQLAEMRQENNFQLWINRIDARLLEIERLVGIQQAGSPPPNSESDDVKTLSNVPTSLVDHNMDRGNRSPESRRENSASHEVRESGG